MIIVCPKCSTRYMIPDGSVPDEGRKVRCNSCGETWLQTKAEDESSDDIVEAQTNENIDDALSALNDMDFDDAPEEQGESEEVSIPDAVKPDLNLKPAVEQDEVKRKTFKDHIPASIAACMILFIFVMVFLSSADSMILKHPNLRPIYAAFNKDPFGQVEDVIFDRVELAYNEENHGYDITGALINLKAAPVILPAAKVTFSDVHYEILDVWKLELSDMPYLAGESAHDFAFSYPMDKAVADNVRSVVLEFLEEEIMLEDKADSMKKDAVSSDKAFEVHKEADAHSKMDDHH